MPRLFCKSENCTVKTKFPNGLCSKHGGTYNLLIQDTPVKVSKVSKLPTIRNKCYISNCTNSTVSPTGKCTRHNKSCPNCIE